MKKNNYRTISQIYIILFISLFGTLLSSFILFLLFITVQKTDDSFARSDWPQKFTKEFDEQISFVDGNPQISESGIQMLKENQIGMQLLNDSGDEIYSFDKPQNVTTHYTISELLELNHTGHYDTNRITSFLGTVTYRSHDYPYILHFPMNITAINMYLNGNRFTAGKTIFLIFLALLLLLLSVIGLVYGLWNTHLIRQLNIAIHNIATRCYHPHYSRSIYKDLYDSLNVLDLEIQKSDQLQAETEAMRREWLANITHDLKTPLSPIKGYAEVMLNNTPKTEEQQKKYAKIMLKNAAYMEDLINDLKLTYQLELGMVPVNIQEQNLIQFLRELVIDILNRPEYENRIVHFESMKDTYLLCFDSRLMMRAIQNLVINCFVHGDSDTEVALKITTSSPNVTITISDNGKGMTKDETKQLFERYYRGASTEKKPEGSGLGLAIAKSIIELHTGTICVSSIPHQGTTFTICFSSVKDN